MPSIRFVVMGARLNVMVISRICFCTFRTFRYFRQKFGVKVDTFVLVHEKFAYDVPSPWHTLAVLDFAKYYIPSRGFHIWFYRRTLELIFKWITLVVPRLPPCTWKYPVIPERLNFGRH